MKKILIIEDDSFIRDTISKKLIEKGFEVSSAKDVDDADDFIKNISFDMILLDMLLPKSNGIEILKKIKSDQNTSKIPVIIFSNISSNQDIKTAKELGAVEYLVKASFTPNEVVNKINNILSK